MHEHRKEGVRIKEDQERIDLSYERSDRKIENDVVGQETLNPAPEYKGYERLGLPRKKIPKKSA